MSQTHLEMPPPPIVIEPSTVQLFRYSAVTWNPHRIHYDQDWARHEGYPGVLVQSHLHAANAIRVVTQGLGSDWELRRFAYRVLRPAWAGVRLTAEATSLARTADGKRIEATLREKNAEGAECLSGKATAERVR